MDKTDDKTLSEVGIDFTARQERTNLILMPPKENTATNDTIASMAPPPMVNTNAATTIQTVAAPVIVAADTTTTCTVTSTTNSNSNSSPALAHRRSAISEADSTMPFNNDDDLVLGASASPVDPDNDSSMNALPLFSEEPTSTSSDHISHYPCEYHVIYLHFMVFQNLISENLYP